MILNAYSVLDTFVVIVRMLLAMLIVVGGLRAWRTWRTMRTVEQIATTEKQFYLLFLTALVLLILNIASWPLFFILLQSYVSEWPAAMCVYGVTQIGAFSQGTSSALPGLVSFIEWSKPALVFVSGSWLVLYLINRRTVNAALTGRILLLLIALGICAALDSVAEAFYLAIPKIEDLPSGGCCAFDPSTLEIARIEDAVASRQSTVQWTFHISSISMIVALGACCIFPGKTILDRRHLVSFLLGVGAVISSIAGAFYISDIVSTRLLGLENHHCVYCLFRDYPESIVATLLLVAGAFSVGWSVVAIALTRKFDVRFEVDHVVRKLISIALWAYLGSVTMFALELALAQ